MRLGLFQCISLFVLSLAACAGPEIGQGKNSPIASAYPPELEHSGRGGWDSYVAAKKAKAFAIGDVYPGQHRAWSYEQDYYGNRGTSAVIDRAMSTCRSYNRGQACTLYAVGDELVGNRTVEEMKTLYRGR